MKRRYFLLLVLLIGIAFTSGCGQTPKEQQSSEHTSSSVKILNSSCHVGDTDGPSFEGKYYTDYNLEISGSASGEVYSSLFVDFGKAFFKNITSPEWGDAKEGDAYPTRDLEQPATTNWIARGVFNVEKGQTETTMVSVKLSDHPEANDTVYITVPC